MGELRVEAAYDSDATRMLPPPPDQAENRRSSFGGPHVNRRYYNGGYKQMNMHVQRLAPPRLARRRPP